MTYIPFYMAFSDTYLSSHPKLMGNLAARKRAAGPMTSSSTPSSP